MRILLLSDNQAVANVVTLCLDKPGYEIVSDIDSCDLVIKDLENPEDDISKFDFNKTLFLIGGADFDTFNVPNKIQKPFLPSKLIDFLTSYENSVDIVAKSLKETVNSGSDIDAITNIVDEIDLLDNDKNEISTENTNKKESLVTNEEAKILEAKKDELLEILDDDFMDKHSPHKQLEELIDEDSPLVDIAKKLDSDEFIDEAQKENDLDSNDSEISLENLANNLTSENADEIVDGINLLDDDVSLEDFANSILDKNEKSETIQKELNLKTFSNEEIKEDETIKLMNFDEKKEDNLNKLKENIESGVVDLIKKNIDETSLKNLKINVVVTFEEK